jgi:ABC-type spermidine/putrescine transport system permease subunit II
VRRPGAFVSLTWAYVVMVLLFLYLPLVPPVLFSLSGGGNEGQGPLTLAAYTALWQNPVLVGAVQTSALLALLTGVFTPPIGLLAAMGVRELGAPRTILMLLLMPLFIPGVSMGLAAAFFFRFLGVSPSLWTILIVQILWALPFAFLIILTAMAQFDPGYLEAAYVHGASRFRAFLDVELPLIRTGIAGAGAFALILSLNETVRTALVQGPLNTVPTYIWSTYLQVGLSPALYALMSLMTGLTLGVIVALSLLRRGRREPTVAS